MERKEFEKLFTCYLNAGFQNIDIELENGSTIVFDGNVMLSRFLGGEFQISASGLLIQIDYSTIKGIAI